ncbi:hypothetical protein P7K49_033140 [Saguinus oedipus]|uniref:Uncharacterized protein n=1 Tax=Saguinus oedipus TaxID=9490 RepID=A0ABQ9TS57_SAGOE|nr:hypothetical protein P7K49_033140 [Saguinus oedipus]
MTVGKLSALRTWATQSQGYPGHARSCDHSRGPQSQPGSRSADSRAPLRRLSGTAAHAPPTRPLVARLRTQRLLRRRKAARPSRQLWF